MRRDGAPSPAEIKVYVYVAETYHARMGKERILVADFEELRVDPGSMLRRTCDFLGLEFDASRFPRMDDRIHAAPSRPTPGLDELDSALYARLKTALEPEYEELHHLLPGLARRWRARHFDG